MSESLEIKKAKIDSLVAGFKNSGIKSGDKVGQTELIQFLNRRSSSGRFDPIISEKLFQVISLDAMSSLSIEEFINGFLQFEEEIRKNAELFSIKLASEEEIYAQLSEEFRKYKEEKLNAEGLCEDAKVYGEITEIDIKRKLEGIKEIIIKIVFNEKSEELHFKIGDLNSSNEMSNKTFEFKPTSRKDHFEFIMKGINDRNQVFDIGSKVFPLTEINSHEEYLVQIVVPEIENEEQIAAYIKAKIVVYWSDYRMYEKQKKKAESKLKKLTIAKSKAEEYLRKIREIYGDLTRKKPDLIVDFNNEKLMQRKGAKLNVNFNNIKEAEAPGGNYIVEFNNQKEVEIKQQVQVQETQVTETKEEHLIEVTHEPELKAAEPEVNLNPEEYQNAFGATEQTEQVNIEQYADQTNYEQYQTTGYEEVQEPIPDLQSTEVVKETEIRNSIQEAVIRQSLNKPLYTENTLPIIRQEKVNKVIYDTNVKTLPLIFGGKKVTYLNEEESRNYDFGNLLQQGNVEEIEGQEYTNTQIIQGQNYSTQEVVGQEYNLPHITPVQDYTTTTQDFTTQIGQTQDFSTQIIQGQDYSTQINQMQEYSQISPELQNSAFGEYKRTSY